MKALRRNFLLSVTLAAAAVTPGLGQAAPGTASIPDFSGMWAHPSLPGFEPLASGPTSLKNRVRRPDGVSNVLVLVGDYTNPILKPEAAATVKKFGEMSLSHFGFHNPRNQCWPNGVPFILPSNGMEMFQQRDKITMIYQTDHQVRHIRMNASHPAVVTPSWYGDSVGHYEGDTLVVDTVGIKAGPFAMIDWFGTPQTAALHVVERYRLLDYDQAKEGIQRAFKDNTIAVVGGDPPVVDLNYHGKWLQLLFTVDDPNVFTTPWSATVTYGPQVPPALKGFSLWPEDVCAENPHKYGTEEDVQVPTAKVADF
jgi:hypothetical protein